MDDDRGTRVRQLASQPRDMRLKGIGLDFVVRAIDFFFEQVPPHRPPRPAHQAFQHQIFAPWQIEPFAGNEHFALIEVECQIAHAQRLGCHLAGPAQHGAQPRHQFADHERLGQIIISAQIEPLHPVIGRATGGEDDDGHIGPPLAQIGDQRGAVAIAQLAIQQYQVMGNGFDGFDGDFNRGRDIGDEIMLFQRAAQQSRHIGLVFYQQ